MSLVATGSSTPPADAPTVVNNGFWPDIEPAGFRGAHRLDGTVTPSRISAVLGAAMRDINRQLSTFQAAQELAGIVTAADIPLLAWQGACYYEALYRQAIYAGAHALIMERYTDFTATGDRDNYGDVAKQLAADTYHRDANWAVSEITGVTHATVELI